MLRAQQATFPVVCGKRKTTSISAVNSPDLVASLHSDPLGNRPVLLLLLSKEALDPERLVGRLETTQTVFQHLCK